MPTGLKVLIVDDEQDLLDFYRKLLSGLPSHPEIHTATSGARALALLEEEPFSLLITDLNMPRMDGFQILMMVRRKFPALRTAVITGMTDQQYRARAYAMGIDLYIEKPQTKQELQVFVDCIEALLDRVDQVGFRGVQSKSLVDLVQMECLSQGSSLLKIITGPLQGFIWITDGSIIDAQVEDARGEEAFRRILSWRTGSFEILPPEPQHERLIRTSSQSLLLNSAQWLDESRAADETESRLMGRGNEVLRAIARIDGVEFVLVFSKAAGSALRSWGVDDPEKLRAWAAPAFTTFEAVGEKLRAGQLKDLVATGVRQSLAFRPHGDDFLLLGLRRDLPVAIAREILEHVGGEWKS